MVKIGDKIETLEAMPFSCKGEIVWLPKGSRGKIIKTIGDAWWVKLDKKFKCIKEFQTGKEFERLKLRKVV